MRLSQRDFDRAVERAIARIPEEIRRHLDNIVISVKRRPSRELLRDLGFPPDDPPLGIYLGTSLPERITTAPPLYPDTILIFQEPLEQMCRSLAELEEEIEITVVHEVAHYLGMSEERLAELGYE
jgi:predicted Zn-dependent protease with MMP-like domain